VCDLEIPGHAQMPLEMKANRLVKSVEQNPPYKLTAANLTKKFYSFGGNTKVHYRVHDSLPLNVFLNQMNSVHNFTPYFLKICFEIMLPPKQIFQVVFPLQVFRPDSTSISHLPHTFFMILSCHPQFDNPT
jgi:hypothetical protein